MDCWASWASRYGDGVPRLSASKIVATSEMALRYIHGMAMKKTHFTSVSGGLAIRTSV